MSPAFQEALAARLKWVDVVVLAGIVGCEEQTEVALQAAFDAVHELASNDVLTYQHYGPRAPLLFADVVELADQYNLSHELYTELYHANYHNGSIGALAACWKAPAEPLPVPYSKWLARVSMHLGDLMGLPCWKATHATSGQGETLLLAWSRAMEPAEAANEVRDAYADYEMQREFEEEEARQRYMEDIADTYASIEADLWKGWRQEYQDDQRLDEASVSGLKCFNCKAVSPAGASQEAVDQAACDEGWVVVFDSNGDRPEPVDACSICAALDGPGPGLLSLRVDILNR